MTYLKELKRTGHGSIQPKEHLIQMNIIFRFLPQGAAENVTNKVNSVIMDGLKLTQIKVVCAEKKESRGERFPGVVVPTYRSAHDKRSMTRDCEIANKFSRAYIMNDKPFQQRIFESDMRVLADSVGDGQLKVIGGHIHCIGEDINYRQYQYNRDNDDRLDSTKFGPRASITQHDLENNTPFALDSAYEQRSRDEERSTNQRDTGHRSDWRSSGRRGRSNSN